MTDEALEIMEKLRKLQELLDQELELIRERMARLEAADARIRQELRDDIRQVTNELQDLDRRTHG